MSEAIATNATAATTAPAATPNPVQPTADAAASTTNKPGSDQKTTNPAVPELFEVKIDGKVVKMTREEVVRAASLGSAAQKRFAEASELTKKAEGVLSRMRDPKQAIAFLQDPALGLDKAQIRTEFENWYKKEFIDREEMSPAERRAVDAEAKLKEHEDRIARDKEQADREAEEKTDATTRANIQKEVIEILETSGLPKTRFTATRVIYWTRLNETNKFGLSNEQIVAKVQQESRGIFDSMVQNSDGEVLAKLLGEDTLKKVRRYDLERLKAKRATLSGKPTETEPAEPAKPREKIRMSDVNRRMRLGKF